MTHKQLLEQAKRHAKESDAAENDLRKLEIQDLKIYAGEQWDDDVKRARSGQQASNGLPSVPARPTLTINKVRAPGEQIQAQADQADMGVEIVPAEDVPGVDAVSDGEVQLREGLIRRIQRDSDAQDARQWAFQRAFQCGRGYYGVCTRYLPGKTNDQEVYIQRFYNQFAVRLDPNHEQPDGSDAKWAQIGVDMPIAEYRSRWPGANVSMMDDDTLRAIGDEAKQGTAGATGGEDAESRTVRVIDYWYTVETSQKLHTTEKGELLYEDELTKGDVSVHDREVTKTEVKWAKLGAYTDVLDQTEWPSPYLPIIKVLGTELHPYDAQRRTEGIVRPAIDSQRGFNAMVSKQVETVALAPIPPLMLAAGQQEGWQAWYDAATTRTLPYLPYNHLDDSGRPFPGPPVRAQVDVPIEAIAQSVQLFDQAIKSTTATPDPTLGNVDPSLKSGKAIKALLEQASRGTSHYLTHLRRSMEYEARIVNSLLYPIYGRTGRIVQLQDAHGKGQTVKIGAPMVLPKPGSADKPRMAKPGEQGTTLTLTAQATFHVAVKIAKSWDTRREQEASDVGDVIAADPQLMNVVGDLYFGSQDGPMAKELAARMKLVLDPRVQQALSSDVPIPPQVQQQMGAAQKMIQELSAHVQQLTQTIQTKQVETDGRLQEAKLNNDTKITIAEIQANATMLQTQAKIDAENARTYVEAIEQRVAKALDIHLKAVQQVSQQLHDTHLQAHDQAHDAAMAALGQAHATDLADQQHQQALDQMGTQAALQPEPVGAGESGA